MINTKKISWWQPRIGPKEYTLIKQVLKSNFPNEGALTGQFERKVEKLLRVKHAIAVTSGTAALYLSLKALGIGPGDEVVVPDLTFIATANAVKMTGAEPILADIDPQTLNLSGECFKKAITKKTKAVIPVHVSGRAANLKEIISIAKSKNIYVVGDAAEGFMSQYNGKFLGTIGNLGCFSFSPAKTITTGQGGMIVTNDSKLNSILRELKDQGRPTRGTGGDDIHYSVGFNFKFTDIQAALGLGQLEYLEARINRIKTTYTLYNKYLTGVKGISLYGFSIEKNEIPQWVDAHIDKRDELDAYLQSKKIYSRKFWYPIHQQIPYKQTDKDFPNSTMLSPKSLWLPSAFTLKDKDIKTVCSHIAYF